MPDDAVEIRFETARFNVSRELEHFLNPGNFGHDAAAWLRWELLLRGVEATPPAQEDWGWCVEAALEGERYLLGVRGFPQEAAVDPDHGEWCITLHKERTFWERLLGRNPLDPGEAAVALVREIVAAVEEGSGGTPGGGTALE